MKNILDYLEKKDPSPVFNFEGKEYKINKDYKITLFLQQEQKKILNNKDEDFNELEAQFNLIKKFFSMVVGKKFVDELDKVELSEDELIFLFNFVINRRSGMSEEEAAEAALGKKKND